MSGWPLPLSQGPVYPDDHKLLRSLLDPELSVLLKPAMALLESAPGPTPPTLSRTPWLPCALALLAVGLVAFSFAFTPFRSSQDDFWHLKAGMLQVENGLPIHGPEPFSYCGPDETWHNHEWLAQRWFYHIFATAPTGDLNTGLFRLILFKALVVSATFVLVAWSVARRGTGWIIAALCGILAAEISRRTIYVRPPIFSYLLMALFIALLHEWKSGRLRFRWLWILPPMTVLWANLHGMVPLAFVTVGAYTAGEWLEALLRSGRQAPFRQRLRDLVQSPTVRWTTALLVTTFVATLLQPSGLELYTLAGKFTKDPLLQRTIAEMLPTRFFFQPTSDSSAGLVFVPGFATFWFVLVILAGLWIGNRGRLQTWADSLMVLFFAYQAVMHWRLLPLFAIVAAPVLGWLLNAVGTRGIPGWNPHRGRPAQILASLTVVLGLTYTTMIGEPPPQTFVRRNLALAQGRVLDSPGDYPVPVVRALLAARPPGQLYSPSNYCGWFMWWLAPEAYRTFADNRFDHFGSRYLHDELILRNALRPGVTIADRPVERTWQEVIAHYHLRTLVVERSTALHKRLRTYPGFRPAYVFVPPGATRQDAGWAIWVTTDGDGTTPTEALQRRFRTENPGAPSLEQIEDWKPDPKAPELELPESKS